jgi:hypothetical protein
MDELPVRAVFAELHANERTKRNDRHSKCSWAEPVTENLQRKERSVARARYRVVSQLLYEPQLKS